jgi:hypothetical protein
MLSLRGTGDDNSTSMADVFMASLTPLSDWDPSQSNGVQGFITSVLSGKALRPSVCVMRLLFFDCMCVCVQDCFMVFEICLMLLLRCRPLLCADRLNFCISIPKTTLVALSKTLNEPRLRLLHGVPGYHEVAANFGSYLATTPSDFGSELTTSHAMATLMECVVFRPLDTYSSTKLDYAFTQNKSEKHSNSMSNSLIPGCRPDMLVIVDEATLLIGEDKQHGNLPQAIKDIEGYVQTGGLSPQQYGQVPGILGYAAAGLVVQFLFIQADGKVCMVCGFVAQLLCSRQQLGGLLFVFLISLAMLGQPTQVVVASLVANTMQVVPVSDKLDLSKAYGRLDAVCTVVNIYRLLARMASQLPSATCRMPLFKKVVRGQAEIMIRTTGALKAIRRYHEFASAVGSSLEVLQTAYCASNLAREGLHDRSKPFMITAVAGPTLSAGGTLRIDTGPLGYSEAAVTEAVCTLVSRASPCLCTTGMCMCAAYVPSCIVSCTLKSADVDNVAKTSLQCIIKLR